jgi:hypothetical protein
MRKSVKLLIVVFAIILLNKCSILDPPEYMHNLWAAIDSVEVKNIYNGFVKFHCWTGVGTPCNEFDRSEVNRENDTIYVRIYSKYEKGRSCNHQLAVKEFEIVVLAERNKVNHFKFWYFDNYDKDLELYVP